MSALPLRFLLATAASVGLSSCNLIGSFPVVTADPVGFGSATVGKALTANITQRGAQLAEPALAVTCAVSLRVTPTRATPVTTIAAVQGPGNSWSCPLPPAFDALIHPNQVLQLQWLVNSGTTVVADSGRVDTMLDCPNPVPTMIAEQGAVLGAFPGLMTFDQIKAAGFEPTHGATSYGGMGVAFIRNSSVQADLANTAESALANLGTPNPGTPDLLLFLPTGAGTAIEESLFADNPYRLIGWAYAETVRPRSAKPVAPSGAPAAGDPDPVQTRPVLPCIPHHEWFFHSSGFHQIDGSFTPAPSRIALGQPAFFHDDLWDIHFFVGPPGGLPTMGIFHPGGAGAVPGIEARENSFYYPVAYD